MRSDGADDTRRRGVNGQHFSPAAGKRLAAQDAIAGLHAKLALCANMLLKRNNKLLRKETWRRGVPFDWVFISGDEYRR